MNIQGFQKVTLLDYPDKVACTIFTGGCNFRCPFCHNASLVMKKRENIISIDKKDSHKNIEKNIISFLKKRKNILDGVCITGGEPLLQEDLEEFIKKIRELDLEIKLDTNGSFPDVLKRLVENRLVDYVAMDIKNSKREYGRTIGREEYDLMPVEESVSFLLKGKVPYEFRTTVTEEFHTEESIHEIGEWIAGAERYFLQQFVDSGDVIQPGLHACKKDVVFRWIEILKEKIPYVEVRGI